MSVLELVLCMPMPNTIETELSICIEEYFLEHILMVERVVMGTEFVAQAVESLLCHSVDIPAFLSSNVTYTTIGCILGLDYSLEI